MDSENQFDVDLGKLLSQLESLEWTDEVVSPAMTSKGSQCGSCSGSCGSGRCKNPYLPEEEAVRDTLAMT